MLGSCTVDWEKGSNIRNIKSRFGILASQCWNFALYIEKKVTRNINSGSWDSYLFFNVGKLFARLHNWEKVPISEALNPDLGIPVSQGWEVVLYLGKKNNKKT